MAAERNKTGIGFLDLEKKNEISQELNFLRQISYFYHKKGPAFIEKFGGMKKAINFEEKLSVDNIKKILNEAKVNGPKEEKTKKLLEQNILETVEKITMGIDYWENVEALEKRIQHQLLEEYIKDNLTKHAKFNDRVQKKLEERAKQEEIEDIYWEIDKPEELLEEIEDGKLNEVVIKVIEKGEQDASIHYKGLTEVSKKWNEKKLKWWVDTFYKKLLDLNVVKNWTIEHNEKLYNEQAQTLKEEVAEKSKRLEKTNIVVGELKDEIRKLKEELEKKSNSLEKANQVILEEKSEKKELKNQLHLAIKSLPSLPKKQSKFKQLRTKVKTKFHQLTEKKKHQIQELIARIEVRSN